MKSGSTTFILSLATLLCLLFGTQQLQAADGVDVMQAQSMARQGA